MRWDANVPRVEWGRGTLPGEGMVRREGITFTVFTQSWQAPLDELGDCVKRLGAW